jgi:hypothetical protein
MNNPWRRLYNKIERDDFIKHGQQAEKIGDKIKGTRMGHVCCYWEEIRSIQPKRWALTSLFHNKQFKKLYCQQGLHCLSKCPYSYTNRKIEKNND